MNQQFEEQGFFHIKQAFKPEEVDELIAATDRILCNPRYQYDLLAIDASKETHKILYPLEKDPSFLKYLVHEAILKILLKTIANPTEIVPTWEDILIKVPFKGIPVTFHQDLALQSTKHDIFSLGIYLHSSQANPVYYLPGSHRYGALSKTELYKISTARLNEFQPVVAEPGDIIMHKVKTIHYSERNLSPHRRYTWYLEFRTLTQLFEDSPWDKSWIYARRAIFAKALALYQPHYLANLVQDRHMLQPYLDNLQLRVPHQTATVKYDMQSPYNHFA